ncbi:hypothetical protein NIES2104_10400 [Leptolyngbya sp. NIES-2104]|nr:hypothetical protein NIES2104_10400 [Leptolyngbya sp. NIES-2104]
MLKLSSVLKLTAIEILDELSHKSGSICLNPLAFRKSYTGLSV